MTTKPSPGVCHGEYVMSILQNPYHSDHERAKAFHERMLELLERREDENRGRSCARRSPRDDS